jgi:hypothetical protein
VVSGTARPNERGMKMLHTDRDKRTCAKYSARDKSGLVHCNDCPLVISKSAIICKANSHYNRLTKAWEPDERMDSNMPEWEAIKQLETLAENCYYPRDVVAIWTAIAALTAQVPRVLLLEEKQNLSPNAPAWLEWKRTGLSTICELQNLQPYVFDDDYYLIKVRAWIGNKPTAEQMHAEPWKKGEEA